jgi:hypothetical protein
LERGYFTYQVEFNHSVRNLKADLEFIPSCDAKTALLADFQALQEYPNIEWYDEPEPEAYKKILQDEKALEPLLKFKTVTRKKFHRDEKLSMRLTKITADNSQGVTYLVVVPLSQPAFIYCEAPRFPATPGVCEI